MKRDWMYLEHEDVLKVHNYLVAKFGGMEGVREEGLLESALAQPRQTFGGEDLYASASQKAARYAYGIINNHPFADGNKRTGAACIGMFLRGNGIWFKPSSKDLYDTLIAVADGSMSYENLVAWLDEQVENS